MKVLGIPVHVWRRLYMINLVIIALIAAIGFSLPSAHAQNVTIDSTRNCDANAVIFCGAGSVNQLINKFDNGDGRNSVASIHNIYSFFGVSAADIHSMANSGVDVRAGSVTRSGDVFDGSGHLVATGAMTGGRQNMAGSTRETLNGTVFFVRPPSVSFASNSLHAFVVMQNGRFAFAVLASCGNVVKATPMAPAPAPKPTPPTPAKPTPTTTTTNVCSGNTTNSANSPAAQGGNCSTNTTIVQTQTPAPATPAAPSTTTPATTSSSSPTCDALTISQGDNRTVTITGLQTTANGATMTGVDINWGDGTIATNLTNVVGQTHQFAKDGTFTISATVHFMMPGATTSTQTAMADGSATVGQSVTTQADAAANQTAQTSSQAVTADGPNCQRLVSFTTPTPVTPSAQVTAPVTTTATTPTTLVNTGPGSLLGTFIATSILGGFGYRRLLQRRLSQGS